MKTVRLLLGLAVLSMVSCGGSGSGSKRSPQESLRDVDLSGAWRIWQTTQVFDISGKYRYSYYISSRHYIVDSDGGTYFRRCGSDDLDSVVKSDHQLVFKNAGMNGEDEIYLYQGHGVFLLDAGIKTAYNGTKYRTTVKVAFLENFQPESVGTISIEQPFQFENPSDICISSHSNNRDSVRGVDVWGVFEDGLAGFSVYYEEDVEPAVYTYERYSESNVSVPYVDVNMDYDLQVQLQGDCCFDTQFAVVEVQESEAGWLRMLVEATSEDSYVAIGYFEINPEWLRSRESDSPLTSNAFASSGKSELESHRVGGHRPSTPAFPGQSGRRAQGRPITFR